MNGFENMVFFLLTPYARNNQESEQLEKWRLHFIRISLFYELYMYIFIFNGFTILVYQRATVRGTQV